MAGKWGRNAATADDLKETKRILEIERGGIRWHCVENRLWKSLWETKKKKKNKYSIWRMSLLLFLGKVCH